MAKRVIDGATLSAIADATRNLTGATGVLTPEQITSQLQAEIDSGKVKLETCKVKFTSVEAQGDVHYVVPGYGYLGSYITPGDSGSTFDMYKNTIVCIDTNCSSCIVSGNIELLVYSENSGIFDWQYVLSVTGDCDIELLLN